MTIDRIASYTAASQFPLKVLRSRHCVGANGRINPAHLQFNPTNACNLACSFCSCANRSKTERMSLDEARQMLERFAFYGTRAITITGGGEPLLHPHINEIVRHAFEQSISVGLVTNGLLAERLSLEKMRFSPVWIRVSCADERDVDELIACLDPVVNRMRATDWSFSYVLTSTPDYDKLRKIVRFAFAKGFCHVRVVADLLDVVSVPDMGLVRVELQDTPGEDLVVYQGRKEFTPGRKNCLISLLKPVVGPDGGVWPCCGVQYALTDPSLDLEAAMRMGHWEEFGMINEAQLAFNGSRCVRCYYDDYNRLLEMMTGELEHKEFV